MATTVLTTAQRLAVLESLVGQLIVGRKVRLLAREAGQAAFGGLPVGTVVSCGPAGLTVYMEGVTAHMVVQPSEIQLA